MVVCMSWKFDLNTFSRGSAVGSEFAQIRSFCESKCDCSVINEQT